MADAYQDRLRAIAKIRKLMATAVGRANPHEAEQALKLARTLADKHEVDLATLRLAPSKHALPSPERMSGALGAISKAFPGRDDEDYSQYARKGRGEAKKPYFSDLGDEEVPE